MYRLVFNEKITVTEAETIMSIQDVLDANEMYTIWFDAMNAPAEG